MQANEALPSSMQLNLHNAGRSDGAASVPSALLAVPLFEDGFSENPLYLALDKALGGVLARVVKDEQFTGKSKKTLLLHTHGKIAAERVLLYGLGKAKDYKPADLRAVGAKAVKEATRLSLASTAATLPTLDAALAERSVQFLAEGLTHGAYRFDKYLTGEKKKPWTVKTAQLIVPVELADGAHAETTKRAMARGQTIAAAVQLARDLINEPAAYATPSQVALTAEKLAKDKGLTITVLGPAECKKLGMGMFLGVSQGADEEPRFVHLTYLPPKGKKGDAKTIALIGKGVTFDSGGLSLKPSDAMLDMKVDMSGAAAVIAAMGALADLGCTHEVHAFAALTENMLSGKSYKLGDVLKSMDGKTVEINNTDAEGRLTLGDAITYAKQTCKPDEMYDFATLTGACMVALGPHIAGVMSNDDALADRWLASSKRSGEEMWRLPLPDRLMEQLKSEIADLRNTGERWGGALTAGLFLKEFVGDTPWVHVDIAGPASTGKETDHVAAGGTGFAVATIVEHLSPRD